MAPLFDQLVRLSGRSWWEVKFLGGATLGEWQTAGVERRFEFPLRGLQARSRWEQLDHSKIVAARLVCPDGQQGEVQGTGPNRIFQFKAGRRFMSHDETVVDAHVLGVVVDDNGHCDGWEWTRLGLGRFRSVSILHLHERYGQGPLNLEAIGVRL